VNNNTTQTILPLVIGITLGAIIGLWLLTTYINLPWFIGSMALLSAFIAWWQIPCIRAVLDDASVGSIVSK